MENFKKFLSEQSDEKPYKLIVFQNSGDTVIYFIQNSNVLAFYRNSGSTVNGNSGDIFGNRDFILTGAFVAA